MAVKLIVETKEEKESKKDALILIKKIKAMNYENVSLKILELMEIPDQLKIVLRQYQYYAATQNILITVDQALEKFINLAYENGVKNLNPFMTHMFKYNNNLLNELDKENLKDAKKELDKLLNNYTVIVNKSDLFAIVKILSKVKRNTKRIGKGEVTTITGKPRINEVFLNASECWRMVKNIQAA